MSSSETSQTCDQQCPLPTPEAAQPIINTILADINAIMPNFSSLVSSYRLLVGAAEEIHRIPGVCPDVFERAVRRFDNAGTLIDILLDLLCCKISFSSDFLEISCLPVDLFRLLANRTEPCDQSHRTAEQIITLEALRNALADCKKNKCFPKTQVVCPVPNTTTAGPSPQTAGIFKTTYPNHSIKNFFGLRPDISNEETPDKQEHNGSSTDKSSQTATNEPDSVPCPSSTLGTKNFENKNATITSSVRRRHI